MRKHFALYLLISIVFICNGQNFGNLAGSMTGTGITSAASNAAKQLQTMVAGNTTATNNLSQLQLLGLDPAAIQKYLRVVFLCRPVFDCNFFRFHVIFPVLFINVYIKFFSEIFSIKKS